MHVHTDSSTTNNAHKRYPCKSDAKIWSGCFHSSCGNFTLLFISTYIIHIAGMKTKRRRDIDYSASSIRFYAICKRQCKWHSWWCFPIRTLSTVYVHGSDYAPRYAHRHDTDAERYWRLDVKSRVTWSFRSLKSQATRLFGQLFVQSNNTLRKPFDQLVVTLLTQNHQQSALLSL